MAQKHTTINAVFFFAEKWSSVTNWLHFAYCYEIKTVDIRASSYLNDFGWRHILKLRSTEKVKCRK